MTAYDKCQAVKAPKKAEDGFVAHCERRAINEALSVFQTPAIPIPTTVELNFLKD